jgi:hypothetical protein
MKIYQTLKTKGDKYTTRRSISLVWPPYASRETSKVSRLPSSTYVATHDSTYTCARHHLTPNCQRCAVELSYLIQNRGAAEAYKHCAFPGTPTEVQNPSKQNAFSYRQAAEFGFDRSHKRRATKSRTLRNCPFTKPRPSLLTTSIHPFT